MEPLCTILLTISHLIYLPGISHRFRPCHTTKAPQPLFPVAYADLFPNAAAAGGYTHEVNQVYIGKQSPANPDFACATDRICGAFLKSLIYLTRKVHLHPNDTQSRHSERTKKNVQSNEFLFIFKSL